MLVSSEIREMIAKIAAAHLKDDAEVMADVKRDADYDAQYTKASDAKDFDRIDEIDLEAQPCRTMLKKLIYQKIKESEAIQASILQEILESGVDEDSVVEELYQHVEKAPC